MQGLIKTLVVSIALLIAIVLGAYYYVSSTQAELPVTEQPAGSTDGATHPKTQAANDKIQAQKQDKKKLDHQTGNQGSKQRGKQQSTSKSGGRPSGGRGRRASLVVISDVTEGTINDRLSAVGDVEAMASVNVLPFDGGLLREVLIESGQAVTAGSVLALLDSEAEEIARNQAKSSVNEARVKVIRVQKLFKSRTSTQAELDAAQSVLNSARLALQDAELKLLRRIIKAPIDGKVGIINVTVGSFITNQTSIATIDNRSNLLLDFWVPERFANAVKIGQPINATSYAFPGKEFKGQVSAVGSRVERDSRTFMTRAMIANESDLLRPGMSFSVEMRFKGDTHSEVDPLSVQWDSEGSYVWKLMDNKVSRTAIRIVQRNTDKVLVDGELSPGDKVVSEGVLSLREGATVRVAGDEAARPKSGNNQTP